jgi:hypothetical protein
VIIMARREQNPTVVGVTQYLDPEYWAWAATDPAAASLLGLGAGAIVAHAVGLLEAAGCEIAEAYGIIHDADEREVWSDVEQATVIEAKPHHIHIVIKFVSRTTSASLLQIATLLGVKAQYVEKPGRGSHAYDNMLAYLTHAKYPEKHQYSPAEVATVRGPDYLGVDGQRRSDWLKGRAHIVKKRAANGLEDLIQKVLTGQITKSQVFLTDELFEIYGRNMRVIDEAFVAYGIRRALRAAVDLKAGAFHTQVVFFTGKSGAGKSLKGEEFIDAVIAQAAQHGLRWEMYNAATNNILDSWNGEEILFLDEARGAAMGAADWLLLLNPYRASPAAARYKNKPQVAPRIVVITAPTSTYEYFFYVRQKGQVDEAMDQFIRRVKVVVTVVRADDDELSCVLQRIGKVPQYQHELLAKDTDGFERRQSFSLEHGPVQTVEHTAVGITAALMLDLAACSQDVPFESGSDWRQLESLVCVETEDHTDREAIRANDNYISSAIAERDAILQAEERRLQYTQQRLEQHRAGQKVDPIRGYERGRDDAYHPVEAYPIYDIDIAPAWSDAEPVWVMPMLMVEPTSSPV